MIAGGLGELVDFFLGDRVPVADAHFLADVLLELFDAGDRSVCHIGRSLGSGAHFTG